MVSLYGIFFDVNTYTDVHLYVQEACHLQLEVSRLRDWKGRFC